MMNEKGEAMKKVLIIDDSKMFRRILKEIVNISYEVAGEAGDGDEGFQQHQQLTPDITLLDITMPNSDGRECLKKILEHYPQSKVIMLSGVNSQKVVEECISLGAIGYIHKSMIDISNPESKLKTLNAIITLVEKEVTHETKAA